MVDIADIQEQTVSRLFASFMQTHVAMTDTDQEIRELLQLGRIAWNLSLLPDDNQQDYIDNMDSAALQDSLATLLANKQDLFSYMSVLIDEVEFFKTGDQHYVKVRSEGQTDQAEIFPKLADAQQHMSPTLDKLNQLERTAQQLQFAMQKQQFDSRQRNIVDTLYFACLSRSELRWYTLLLTAWKELQPHPRVQSVISHRLEQVNEIDDSLKEILITLEAYHEELPGEDDMEAQNDNIETLWRYAKEIDAHVSLMLKEGADSDTGDELILTTMYDYMERFKFLMDNASNEDLNALAVQFPGYLYFAKLLERMAEGIQDGVIEVPQDH